jgi:phosphatidate cytidylyltransferase
LNIPNVVQRILLAILGIPLVYLCLRQGGILLLAAVDIIIFFCLAEFIHLLRRKNFRPNWILTVVPALGMSWDIFFSGGDTIPFILFITMTLTFMVGLVHKDRSTLFMNTSLSLLGVLFIGFCISCILLIRQLPRGADLVVLLFLLIWVCDTAAYFVGKNLGRHTLWPQISPKKTAEGTVAGFFGAWAAACVAKLTFFPELSTVNCIALGTIAGIFGQAGDLVESAFKRGMGVKDSSHILPGHGGFLDRFDSLLLAAPSMYYYMKFLTAH